VLKPLREWPVKGFAEFLIFYLLQGDTIRVIRVLHGSRDVNRIRGKRPPATFQLKLTRPSQGVRTKGTRTGKHTPLHVGNLRACRRVGRLMLAESDRFDRVSYGRFF
jgi:hypothetical protein